jgi:hypothetical protein
LSTGEYVRICVVRLAWPRGVRTCGTVDRFVDSVQTGLLERPILANFARARPTFDYFPFRFLLSARGFGFCFPLPPLYAFEFFDRVCRFVPQRKYSLRPILFFTNIDVSRHILVVDTSVLAKSIIDRREYGDWRVYSLHPQVTWQGWRSSRDDRVHAYVRNQA